MKYTVDTSTKTITLDIIDNIKLRELKNEIIKLEELFEEYTIITSTSRMHLNPYFIPPAYPYVEPVKNPYIISCTSNNTLK